MPTSTDWSSTRAERGPRAQAAVEDALAAVERLLADVLPAGAETSAAIRAAGAHARLVGAAAGPSNGPRVAVAALLAEALGLLCPRLERTAWELRLVERAAERSGVEPQSLAVEAAGRALRHPRLLALPPWVAAEAVLELLLAFGPLEYASLWRRATEERPECLLHAGPGCPSRSARDAAQRALGGANLGATARGLLQVVPLPDSDDAVLVARPSAGGRWRALPFLYEAALALRPALDRAARLQRELPAAELLARASERRLARIGFDLHDGPLQSLASLLGDARLLRHQLDETLGEDSRKDLLVGRIGDLKARMVALEFELRTLCHSLESPTVLRKPFERVVEQEIVSFQRLTGTHPSVELSGRFADLTASQRIALLRVVQEALRNVREHSGARNVVVRICTRRAGTEATVVDDGAGFDVDAALARAVRDGRVGLLGMVERVRLLGGSCEVRSRRGGPTTVSALLPRWRGIGAAEAVAESPPGIAAA